MSRNGDAEILKGRVVLVTGSSRGLGAALVRASAERHARVVINCRSHPHAAEALGAELRRGGTDALVCRADVSDYAQAQGLVAETLKAFGRIDILVNTVGDFSWKPVAELEPSEWREMMASNLDSVYHMCRLALPAMRHHHFGRIINVGSVGAEHTGPQPKVSAYSAAKAGVIAFSKALALEEARYGVTVNVVSPGIIAANGEPGAHPPEENVKIGERVPIGRPGSPDDFVRAVLFFASPAADYVTGQVLSVAGGWRG
jgi:NAD(P)-dependent dehydrogenase (short-subunit alcohol dehydrogenase family)